MTEHVTASRPRWIAAAVSIAVMAAAVAVLAASLTRASAAEDTVLTVGSATVQPGDTFEIPVSIVLDSEDDRFNSFDVGIVFDPQVIEVQSVAIHPAMDPGGLLPPTLDNSAGIATILGLDPQPEACYPSCVIFTLTFEAVEAGESALEFSGTLGSADGQVFPGDVVDGQVTVEEGATPTESETATGTETTTATPTGSATATETATPTETPPSGDEILRYVPLVARD